MKKLILILFSLILIAAVFSGCGDKAVKEQSSGGTEVQGAAAQAAGDTQEAIGNAMEVMDTLTNKEWPADKLPSGLPEYMEGEIANSAAAGDEFVIKIDKTTKEALSSYLGKLKELGWSVEESRESIANKGVHELRFTWQGEDHLQMVLYTAEVAPWPSDKLPPDIFPPDNCTLIGSVELIESVPGQAWHTTYICDGVDEAAAEAYFEKLREKGWSGDSQLVKSFEWKGKKYSADIEIYETDDNASTFTLNLMLAE